MVVVVLEVEEEEEFLVQMGIRALQCIILFLQSVAFFLSSGTLLSGSGDEYHRLEGEESFIPAHEKLTEDQYETINRMMTQKDVVTPLTTVPTVNPTSPITTTPIINPASTPIIPVSPLTDPNTPPVTTAPNPNSTPMSGDTPGMSSGQSWCIASQDATSTSLQVALDYACGYGGTDCSPIQQGGSCFNPDTVHGHASYAFNGYYQKNPTPASCDFGGTAVLTNIDPSTQSCRYPSTSTSSSILNTTNLSGSQVFGSVPLPPDTSSADTKLVNVTKSIVACVLMILIINEAIMHLTSG